MSGVVELVEKSRPVVYDARAIELKTENILELVRFTDEIGLPIKFLSVNGQLGVEVKTGAINRQLPLDEQHVLFYRDGDNNFTYGTRDTVSGFYRVLKGTL